MGNRATQMLYLLWRDKEVLKRLPGRPTEWQLRQDYINTFPERKVTEKDLII